MASTTLPTLLAHEDYNIAAPMAFVGDPTVSNGDGMLDLGRIQAASISMNPSKQMASDVGGHQQAPAAFDRGVNPEITLTIDDAQQRVLTAMMSSAKIPDTEASITGLSSSDPSVTVSGDVTGYLATGEVFTITGSTDNDGTYTAKSSSYDSNNDETEITTEEAIDDSTVDGKVIGLTEGNLFRSDIRKIDPPTLIIVPKGKEQNAIERAGIYCVPAVVDTGIGDLTWEDSDGEDAHTPVDYTFQALRRQQDQNGQSLPNGAQMIFSVPPAQVPSTSLSWELPDPHGTS